MSLKMTTKEHMTSNSVALVTGASSGIGLELAKLLAVDGHDLVLVARRKDRLAQIKQELEAKHGVIVHVLAEDLSDPAAADRIHREIQRRKLDVDILINNAGLGLVGSFATTDWEKERSLLQVNMLALTQLTKLLLPAMLRRKRGRILNVSSVAAFVPGPGMALYYASKAYVQSFSEALAEEVAGTGVTITALCPGPTQSEFAQVAGMGSAALFRRTVPTAARVAVDGYRAMLRGQRVVISGLDNQLNRFFLRFLPSWLITSYIRRLH